MTRKKRQSLEIVSDFTEDTIAIAIESFLTLMSFPRQRFTIQPFSHTKERRFGADARLEGKRIRGFRPFYMQFKKPSAYPDISHSKIVKERKAMNVSVDPHSLFFWLLPKKANHNECQHNILYRLHRRLRKKNLGNAAYVCPLFLDRSAYRYHVYRAGIRMWNPLWRLAPWNMKSLRVNQINRVFNFKRIPILAEHISIPPHDQVQNTKHRYSFDAAGKGLCFHSPISLPDGSTTLEIYLKNIAQEFLDVEGKISPSMSYQSLLELSSVVDPEGLALDKILELNPKDPISCWLFFGDFLRREYNIEQFAFISWDDT